MGMLKQSTKIKISPILYRTGVKGRLEKVFFTQASALVHNGRPKVGPHELPQYGPECNIKQISITCTKQISL